MGSKSNVVLHAGSGGDGTADMSIGEVAARLGLTTSSIRYYDGAGLLGVLPRITGQRRFDEACITRLRFIKIAQSLGFTLDEIRGVLHPTEEHEWADLVAAKRSELVSARKQIDAMLAMLDESLECGCEAFDKCPVLATES